MFSPQRRRQYLVSDDGPTIDLAIELGRASPVSDASESDTHAGGQGPTKTGGTTAPSGWDQWLPDLCRRLPEISSARPTTRMTAPIARAVPALNPAPVLAKSVLWV